MGLGECASIAKTDMEYDLEHLRKLSERFWRQIHDIPFLHFNGSIEHGFPGILNYSVEFVEGESLIMSMKNVAFSSGSACTSASLEPSYVLWALGVREDLAHTSFRMAFGRFTTEDEIDFTTSLLRERV